ncbi:uncharacterized protein [Procambarus clarkii]|uniref:uncharacterized protein n=1 Tax=Procambarus clarkii TaxID=6728 RepID=UPI003744731C
MNEITEGLHTLVERQRVNQDGKNVSNFSTNSHHKPQRTATTVVKPDFNKSSPKWKSGNVGTYTVNPINPVVSTTPMTSPTVKRCLFCNNEHLTYKCSTYPDHNNRIRRLQELHRCTRCTGPHDPNSCTVSLRMCNKCHKGRHHYSLCGSDQSRSTNSHKKTTNSTSVQYCKVHQDISVLATESNNTTTLPTAQLKLITKGSRISTRGLFDQGSQKTFISQQLVNQLKLKPIARVNLNISGFRPIMDLVTTRFASVLFGATSSPFLLQATLDTHLKKSNSPYKTEISNNLYVDNFQRTTYDENKLVVIYHEANRELLGANMPLQSWATNNKQLNQMIEEEFPDYKVPHKLKVFGMEWNTSTDKLNIKSVDFNHSPLTMRKLLSHVSKPFDPLGLLSPILIKGKLLMQECWQRNLRWDETLPEDLQEKWQQLIPDYNKLSILQFPRNTIGLNLPTNLHVFCNASGKAYGSVAYLVNTQQSFLLTSKDNPADYLSRGLTLKQLVKTEMWFNGPQWLVSGQWPQQKQQVIVTNVTTPVADPELPRILAINSHRYSNLSKLLRVTEMGFDFINKMGIKYQFPSSIKYWVKQAQQETYGKEYEHLPERLSKSLGIWLDSDNYNILRCGERLLHAEINLDTKNPILLPRHHIITKLIVLHYHEHNTLHGGVLDTLTEIRQRFWLPQGRYNVKSLIKFCVICKRYDARVCPYPGPPPLPKERVVHLRPFETTGVTYTGALILTGTPDKIPVKAYICLFTCATTRGVHLEVTSDMSAEAFLQAFRRFAARRSCPKLMISDNGSNFVAGEACLQEIWNHPEVHSVFKQRQCYWKFNPLRAPSHGGFFERMVGTVKKCLRKTLHRQKINLTELQTLVMEIEARVDNRPLTYLTEDFSQREPLSPSHLMHGGLLSPLISLGDEDPADRDLVLVDSDGPRSDWPIGKIVDIHPDRRGILRIVKVQCRGTTTLKTLEKLVPLELAEHECSTDIPVPQVSENNDSTQQSTRPSRVAAQNCKQKLKQYFDSIQE